MMCGGKNLMLVYEESQWLAAVMSVIICRLCQKLVVDLCLSIDLC